MGSSRRGGRTSGRTTWQTSGRLAGTRRGGGGQDLGRSHTTAPPQGATPPRPRIAHDPNHAGQHTTQTRTADCAVTRSLRTEQPDAPRNTPHPNHDPDHPGQRVAQVITQLRDTCLSGRDREPSQLGAVARCAARTVCAGVGPERFQRVLPTPRTRHASATRSSGPSVRGPGSGGGCRFRQRKVCANHLMGVRERGRRNAPGFLAWRGSPGEAWAPGRPASAAGGPESTHAHTAAGPTFEVFR